MIWLLDESLSKIDVCLCVWEVEISREIELQGWADGLYFTNVEFISFLVLR